MKTFELAAGDDNSCTIVERAMGTNITNTAPLPASKHRVVALMKRLLSNPDSFQEHDGDISVSRTRDELHLVVGMSRVPLRWHHVFPLVLEEA